MQPTANGREGPGSIPSDAKLGLQLAVLKSRLGEVERTNVALEREVDQRRAAEKVARSQTRALADRSRTTGPLRKRRVR
jgi:hypothetical protein